MLYQFVCNIQIITFKFSVGICKLFPTYTSIITDIVGLCSLYNREMKKRYIPTVAVPDRADMGSSKR